MIGILETASFGAPASMLGPCFGALLLIGVLILLVPVDGAVMERAR